MIALKDPPSGLSYVSARNYQVAGVGAWTAVDTALVDGHFQHTIAVAGDRAKVAFRGSIQPKVNNGEIGFNVAVNGTPWLPGAGILWDATAMSANVLPISFEVIVTGLTPGNNTFRLEWSATHTAFLLFGSGNANRFTPPMWYAVEAP
ncbi:MAG: hypothetical protein ACTS5I_05125 [Rhodanobacter sp.]